jgi:endonuclease-3
MASEPERAAADEMLRILMETYPGADCALHHRNAWELLCATILSAQCTDKRVNMVTPALFERYPDAEALAAADPADVEQIVRSTGFFREKTKSLIEMSQDIVERFGGRVPETMEELTTLRGVARKTANVILGTAFRKNEGVVVDTHVSRLARRLGWTQQKDPVKIERDLMELFPRDLWTVLGHTLILHGRALCDAKKPRCAECPVAARCPSAYAV